jgi:hypothetical protein
MCAWQLRRPAAVDLHLPAHGSFKRSTQMMMMMMTMMTMMTTAVRRGRWLHLLWDILGLLS